MPAVFCEVFYVFDGLFVRYQSKIISSYNNTSKIEETITKIHEFFDLLVKIIKAYDSILDLEYKKVLEFLSKKHEENADYLPFLCDFGNRNYIKIVRKGFLEILRLHKDETITDYYEFAIKAFHYTFKSKNSISIMCRNWVFFIFVIFPEKFNKNRILMLRKNFINKTTINPVDFLPNGFYLSDYIKWSKLIDNLLLNIHIIINNFSSFYLMKMPYEYIFSMDDSINCFRVSIDVTNTYRISHIHTILYLYALNTHLCVESFGN